MFGGCFPRIGDVYTTVAMPQHTCQSIDCPWRERIAPPKEEKENKEDWEGLTKSPNLKQSPILILSLSVNLISANLMTPVNSSFDSGTGLLDEIWIWRCAWVGAKREIVPITCGSADFLRNDSADL
jgi:hypothetical protein